jgi:hypothetical protein
LTATVDFPTPPLPLITSILFLIFARERVMAMSCWATAALAEPQVAFSSDPQLDAFSAPHVFSHDFPIIISSIE